jgi:Zn-dependent protease/CBS domain-containing protein
MGQVGSVRLGSIAGIEVDVDWSLLIIFFLIAFSLAAGVFPAWHPDWSPLLAWVTALAAAVLFFASVLTHELSHAIVGRAHGVSIARITLFIFGGMAHMEREPPSWRAEFWMALVGPLTSLLLGFTFLWLAALVGGPLEVNPDKPREALAALGPVATLLAWLGPINILLGLFNLVPGFPLDGGRVLRALIWGATGNLRLATRWASRAGQGFAMLLMGTGLVMMLGLQVPVFGGGFVNGLWLAFIGWFLNSMAGMSYRQLLIDQSLGHVPVRQLMQTRFTRIDPLLRIRTLIDEHLMPSGQRAFPVVEDGQLLGMVSLSDLRKCASTAWPSTIVSEIMTPVAALVTVTPEQEASEALALLGQRDLNQLPVIENNALVGLLRREDIVKWLALHAGADDANTEDRLRSQVPG